MSRAVLECLSNGPFDNVNRARAVACHSDYLLFVAQVTAPLCYLFVPGKYCGKYENVLRMVMKL